MRGSAIALAVSNKVNVGFVALNCSERHQTLVHLVDALEPPFNLRGK
jgi:hypothetical protein